MSSVIETLRKRGYTEDFNTVMKQNKSTVPINPEEFVIDKTYRFEGMTDPEDEAILYAISSEKNNLKGILVNGYGIYADELANTMVEKLRIKKS